MLHRTRLLPAFVATASVLALAGALIAQYGFGLRPCVLCLAQRVPFVLAGLAGLAGLSPLVSESLRHRLMVVVGLLFLINGGIATYHVGVEQHWWASPGCSGSAEALTIEDLAAAVEKPAEVPCDQPALEWHGITMAALNIPYSGGLAVVTLLWLGGWRRRRS